MLVMVDYGTSLTLPACVDSVISINIRRNNVTSPMPSAVHTRSLSSLRLFVDAGSTGTIRTIFDGTSGGNVQACGNARRRHSSNNGVTSVVDLPRAIILSFGRNVSTGSVNSVANTSARTDSNNNTRTVPAPRRVTTVAPRRLTRVRRGTTTTRGVRGRVSTSNNGVAVGNLHLNIRNNLVSRNGLIRNTGSVTSGVNSVSNSVIARHTIDCMRSRCGTRNVSPTSIRGTCLNHVTAAVFNLYLISLITAVLANTITSHATYSVTHSLHHRAFGGIVRFSPTRINGFDRTSLVAHYAGSVRRVRVTTALFVHVYLVTPIVNVITIVHILTGRANLR